MSVIGLYGLTSYDVDAPTYATIAGIMFAAALVTAAIPAWRAAKTDPASILATD